jgi:LAS seventeen-binding protein 1/2
MNQATEYIVSQTKSNIQFLQSINQISSEDAHQILSKLPGLDRNLSSPPIPPRPGTSNYRAHRGYNGNGQVNFDLVGNILDRLTLIEVGNLSFNTGDVIQVVDKSNSNWWTGRLNGREGLFPSSYVEKVLDDAHSQIQQPPPPRNYPSFPTGPHFYPQQPQYGPPPPGNMYSPNPMPFQSGPYPPLQGPPPGPVVVMNTEQPKKQGLLGGGLGNTVIYVLFSSRLLFIVSLSLLIQLWAD